MSCSKWLFQYPNDILVETGSGCGGGIQNALKYGFKEVYSVEINDKLHGFCVNLFRSKKNVHLYLGDSLDVLPKILSKINISATFLLDAHVTSKKDLHGKAFCPVIEEIEMAVRHSVKYGFVHKIIVDNLKYFSGKIDFFDNLSIDDIRGVVNKIDPSYRVELHNKYLSILRGDK